MTLEPGQIIDGKYRILRMLGSGGMGAVYEGENARIHRRVAIKVLHAGVAAKADVVQRFEREAQAAGRIGSEHIVEVLDLGNLPSGERFMVMEYLEGESFGDRIKSRRRLDPREVAPIAYQLLEGLAAAHDAGIIHRDLKPDNVYLLASKGGQRDFVKMLDFGVSKFSALEAESMSMTRTGAVMGIPYYMSPEQARGTRLDSRSDLYSVGVVLYQAVTGRLPFNAETFNELVFKIALESPPPAELVTPGLDPAFATIISKSMLRDVAARFQSAREFQQALGVWIQTGHGVSNHSHGVSSSSGTLALPQTAMPMPAGGGQPLPRHDFASAQQGYSETDPTAPQQGIPPHQGLGHHPSHPNAGFGSPGSQSAPLGMRQSSQQLNASHEGLAITAPQPRNNGMMIVLGLAGTLLVAGGGFGAYRVWGSRGAAAAPTTAPTPPPTEPALTPSAPPSSQTIAATEAPASAVVPSTTADAPAPTGTATTSAPPRGSPPPRPSGNKKPPPPPPPPPTKGGRIIGGDL